MITVMITLWSFLCTSVFPVSEAWTAQTPPELTSVGSERGGGPGIPADTLKELNAETFTLPEYLGNVRDIWKTAGNATGRDAPVTIIHIQDAHCNYEAQHQIARIIEYVNTNYGVKAVNLEGGVKGYDLSPLTSIAEAEVREKVADYFVKNGRVNGAEYFAINNPDKVNLWGIEDTLLYVENLAIYRESLEHKREVEQALTTLSSILTQLKIKHYTKDLLELDAKYIQYKAANLDFKDYLSYLIAKAKEKSIDIRAFSAIYLLHQTLDAEAGIDFKKTGIERDAITKLLQKKLSPTALKELGKKTADFYAGRLSQKDYYIYLINTAKPVSIDIASYPELQKYIAYISMYTAIDKMRIMEEIGELEIQLKETIFENGTQRELDTLSKNLTLLKNIFNISLTKDDYRYYLANKDAFSMRHYTAFINKMAPLDKVSAVLDKNINRLDVFRDSIAKFYGYSTERDKAFLKNMRLEPLAGNQGKVAVMITGGFHAENLRELFRTNNINYVSITPTFTTEAGYQSPYYDLLDGKETGIEKLIDTAMSTMQIYDYLTELGVIIDGQAAKNRFIGSVKILAVLQAKGTCVVRHMKYNEFVTFTAEKDEAGNITNITYAVTRSRADAADPTKTDPDNEPYDITAEGDPLVYRTKAEYTSPMAERAFSDKNVQAVGANDINAVAEYIKNELGRKDIADELQAFAEAGFVNLIWGDYVRGFYGGVGLGLKEPGKAPTGGIYINRNKHLNTDGTVNGKAVQSTLLGEAIAYFFNKGDAFNQRLREAFEAGREPIGLRMELLDERSTADRGSVQSPTSPATSRLDDDYLAALVAMGTFTQTQLSEIEKAKPLYDTLTEAVPMILAIMNRDTKTYDLAPAPLEDAPKTVAVCNEAERKLQKNGLGVYADTYRFGNGEDWFKNLTGKVDVMLKDFAEAVKNQETTARFAIRIMGSEKDREALQLHIARRLGELGFEGDIAAEILKRIRIITIDIADAAHLNPMPDLITDILAMEYDRYLQQDYPGGEASDELLLQLARALNVTTENLRLDPLKKDEFRTVLTNLFTGAELLRIRAIDWKSIDEWKKGQDAVLQAV